MTLGHNMQTYNYAIGLCLLVMVGMVVADYAVPKQDLKKLEAANTEKLANLRREKERLQDNLKDGKKSLEAKIWQGPEDQASAALLASLNELSLQKGVKITSFRPQKALPTGSLRQLGFVMNMEGSFSNVMGLVRLIEERQDRVAIHQFQAVSNDGASDRVNASIGLAVFVPEPETKKPSGTVRKVAVNE